MGQNKLNKHSLGSKKYLLQKPIKIHLSEVMLGDVHDLLWSPGALDRGVREGEDRVSGFEVLDRREGLLDVGRVVVRADTGSLKSLGQAFDLEFR